MDDVKTIIFDYDGTLHDSMAIYKQAFLSVYQDLVNQGFKENKPIDDSEISKYLGQTPTAMWDDFGKGLPEEIKQASSKKIGEIMRSLIDQNQAKLYKGALDTLETLKTRGYHLVFLSNCTNAYMHKHDEKFGLSLIFDDMVNAEMYDYLPKKTILKKIKHRYPEALAIVGDRIHDIEAGYENAIYSIGCTYGFGEHTELERANHKIDSIESLLEIFL